jgi:hypothetical protein
VPIRANASNSLRQIFLVYGAFGIPLFLITIADVGRFFKTFIMSAIQLFYKKELKKRGERKLFREIGEVSSSHFHMFKCLVAGVSSGRSFLNLHCTWIRRPSFLGTSGELHQKCSIHQIF